MPSSDSDDFESADEGHGTVERKKRLSSSNYSDKILESDQELKKAPVCTTNKTDKDKPKVEETTVGWDDFDIDDTEPTESEAPSIDKKIEDKHPTKSSSINLNNQTNKVTSNENSKSSKLNDNETLNSSKFKESEKSQDTGWDDFDDWGQDDFASQTQKQELPKSSHQSQPEPDIKEVTDRLAATSTKSGGWGWGWGVDSLLSTATAGITTLTTQVSQGISTVLEAGIGAPDPEELARKTTKENESKLNETDYNKSSREIENTKHKQAETEESRSNISDAPFPFGSLISGVTKFVETTGTKVITGGLDTLETIGKKTMEVLQEGDPGLAKKRSLLGLNPGDKPVLSQVLREAKARAEEEDRIREEKREAKEVHYENLFDDFEGLVHLEALEMLSRQVNMRIEERMHGLDPEKRQDIKETLQQVVELCEMPTEEDEEEDSSHQGMSKAENFHERLQTATQDLGLKLQFQPLVKQYADIIEWVSSTESNVTEKVIYKRAVSSLAQATALSVELYHKTAEMLLVKERRSTADEADALSQMTTVLVKHVSELAILFTEKLNSTPTENKERTDTYITNVFLEAGNSSTYILNAFQLAVPILQIGAV